MSRLLLLLLREESPGHFNDRQDFKFHKTDPILTRLGYALVDSSDYGSPPPAAAAAVRSSWSPIDYALHVIPSMTSVVHLQSSIGILEAKLL